jgi:hypothetical protein
MLGRQSLLISARIWDAVFLFFLLIVKPEWTLGTLGGRLKWNFCWVFSVGVTWIRIA